MITNNLNQVFLNKKKRLLSIFFTAGYPSLDDTINILKVLDESEVDFIEIGMPFSDPIAEGKTIQMASSIAIENGMNINVLFNQLEKNTSPINCPLVLMGYFNPVFQYGVEKFCKKAFKLGISGVIIPDLPLYEFETKYQRIFDRYNLHFIFLVTPNTPMSRIRKIDELSWGFIYAISSSSTTGKLVEFSKKTFNYFKKLKNMNLKNPIMAGFSISDKRTFCLVSKYTRGGIVGSSFLRNLDGNDLKKSIQKFVSSMQEGL